MWRWLFFVSTAIACTDLVSICEQLKPICIGSIIVDQLQQLQNVADQIENGTTMTALESALPPSTGESQETNKTLEQTIENNLPLIKESLPLIRESLPLIRESLPLIRQFLDPSYYSGDVSTCQKKITCKSCRECPQLREAVTSLVEFLCPQTCRRCENDVSGEQTAEDLVKFYL